MPVNAFLVEHGGAFDTGQTARAVRAVGSPRWHLFSSFTVSSSKLMHEAACCTSASIRLRSRVVLSHLHQRRRPWDAFAHASVLVPWLRAGSGLGAVSVVPPVLASRSQLLVVDFAGLVVGPFSAAASMLRRRRFAGRNRAQARSRRNTLAQQPVCGDEARLVHDLHDAPQDGDPRQDCAVVLRGGRRDPRRPRSRRAPARRRPTSATGVAVRRDRPPARSAARSSPPPGRGRLTAPPGRRRRRLEEEKCASCRVPMPTSPRSSRDLARRRDRRDTPGTHADLCTQLLDGGRARDRREALHRNVADGDRVLAAADRRRAPGRRQPPVHRDARSFAP